VFFLASRGSNFYIVLFVTYQKYRILTKNADIVAFCRKNTFRFCRIENLVNFEASKPGDFR